MSTSQKRNDLIRTVCLAAGWNPWQTFNDKRALDRRLSFAMNGWPVPDEMKRTILEGVRAQLLSNKIKFHQVYWYKAQSYRGEYDKLVVELPL